MLSVGTEIYIKKINAECKMSIKHNKYQVDIIDQLSLDSKNNMKSENITTTRGHTSEEITQD